MTRKTYYLLMPALLLAMVFGLSACKSTSQKAAESIIEKSTNGQADVDLTNNSIKVNTNGSSWETGDKVSLPTDFPSDIYVPEGTIKTALKTDANSSFTVSLESTTSMADIKSAYESHFQSQSWTITSSGAIQNSFSYLAQKGNRDLTVGISDSDGKRIVSITTYTNSTTTQVPDNNTNSDEAATNN
ncbi:MAG: hypothetical protein WCT08_00610 [Patescibacteria group bacterium]|jgi:hypothetical protein